MFEVEIEIWVGIGMAFILGLVLLDWIGLFSSIPFRRRAWFFVVFRYCSFERPLL